jgi:hypothetical protein
VYNPGSIVLTDEGEGVVAFMQNSWPEHGISEFWLENNVYHVIKYELRAGSWHWCFDGVFQKTTKRLCLPFKTASSGDDYTDIDLQIQTNTLPVYPLEYAAVGVEKALWDRGAEFWSCRFRKYVAYKGWDYRRGEMSVGSS